MPPAFDDARHADETRPIGLSTDAEAEERSPGIPEENVGGAKSIDDHDLDPGVRERPARP